MSTSVLVTVATTAALTTPGTISPSATTTFVEATTPVITTTTSVVTRRISFRSRLSTFTSELLDSSSQAFKIRASMIKTQVHMSIRTLLDLDFTPAHDCSTSIF